MNYHIIEKEGVAFLVFDELRKLNLVRHGFSTRIGGISKGCYTSLNVGLNSKDDRAVVRENIKTFTKAVGADPEHLVMSDQVHGDEVMIVTKEDKGKGFSVERDYKGVDGLITNVPGIPLMTFFADCVPLYFVDPVKKVVAVSHGGWKGTLLKIGKRTVEKMIEHYDCDPKTIIAVIGPSIGKCCYEVDKEIIEKFNTDFTNTSIFAFPKGDNKYMLDLWTANHIGLKEIGLLDRNIIMSKLCTSCNIDLFYSYRREKGQTGRMAAIIELL